MILFMSVNTAIRYIQFSCHLCFIVGDCSCTMYSRAVWKEGQREMEGVVPTSWIANKCIAFPHKNAKSASRMCTEPSDSWKQFPWIKTKFSSGKLL